MSIQHFLVLETHMTCNCTSGCNTSVIPFVQGTATKWVAQIVCNLRNHDDISKFITGYLDLNNETLLPKTEKNVVKDPCIWLIDITVVNMTHVIKVQGTSQKLRKIIDQSR